MSRKNLFGTILVAGILSLPVFLVSCKDDDSAPTTPPTQQGEQWSKLSVLQDKVFTPNCAFEQCHTSPNPASYLDLSKGKSYSSLYRVKSILNPSYYRVEPLKPSQSVLYTMINNSAPTLMPPSGKLAQAYIDSIALWIQKGAPND